MDATSVALTHSSLWHRIVDSGPIVATVLMILVTFSVASWAIVFAKLIALRRYDRSEQVFLKQFWDSRSMNDLNTRLGDFAYCPSREAFRSGYAELVRSAGLREAAANVQVGISAAVDNINRVLVRAKGAERRNLESLLNWLAIAASSAPFIGLFGTVWGIMNAFEGIAQAGSASLAAVAPGISEALIATAFGLAAAIPAVIGYNLAHTRIRMLLGYTDGFCVDFLNIAERYLVTDRNRAGKTADVP